MITDLQGNELPLGHCVKTLEWAGLTDFPPAWLINDNSGQGTPWEWFDTASTDGQGGLKLNTGTTNNSFSAVQYDRDVDFSKLQGIRWTIESIRQDSPDTHAIEIGMSNDIGNVGFNLFDNPTSDNILLRALNSSGFTQHGLNDSIVGVNKSNSRKYYTVEIRPPLKSLSVKVHDQIIFHIDDYESQMDEGLIRPSFQITNRDAGTAHWCKIGLVRLEIGHL